MENTGPLPLEGETPFDQKKVVFISAVLLIIIAILAALTFLLSKKQLGQQGVPTGTPSTITAKPAGRFPTSAFKSWVEGTRPHNQTPSANVYSVRTSFNEAYVRDLFKKLTGAVNIKKAGDTYISTFTETGETGQDLTRFSFNAKTGVFSYSSTQGVALPGTTDARTKVNQFLSSLIFDPTLTITDTYKKKSESPDVTYYAIHRDWKLTGLPVLNFVGLLNFPDNTALSSLSFSSRVSRVSDPDIYSTSDSTDSLSRLNEFNTMTIGVLDLGDGDLRVVSIDSNLKILESTQLKTTSLITYQEALAKLRAGQYELFNIEPATPGTTDWDRIFPGNRASSDQAVLTDSVLAYLETPLTTQRDYKPYYVFRGNVKLDSGYNARFIVAVPAAISPFGSILNLIIGKADAQEPVQFVPVTPSSQSTGESPQGTGESQKQTTFETEEETTTPQPTQPPTHCVPSREDLINLKTFGSLEFGQYPRAPFRANGFPYWWAVNPAGGFTAENVRYALGEYEKFIKEADDALQALGPENEEERQGTKIGRHRRFKRTHLRNSKETARRDRKVLEDVAKGGQFCPVRIAGESPTLFVTAPAGTTLTLLMPVNTVYTSPATLDKWTLSFATNDVKSLYYEYSDVKFERPAMGWNINRSGLKDFAKFISKELGLYPSEQEKLIAELEHGAYDISGDKLFVGLIPEDEVDGKLPLVVTPAAQSILRFNFYVGRSKNAQTPKLSAITRYPLQIIEIGAYSE